MKKLRGIVALMALIAASAWVFAPTAATAGTLEEGDCDTTEMLAFSEEQCCGCAGVGPDPGSRSIFCELRPEGRGGTFYCSDEYCPFDEEPCGRALD